VVGYAVEDDLGLRRRARDHPVEHLVHLGADDPADPVRRQATPRPQRHPRPVTQARSGDRYTSVLLVVVLVTGNLSVGIFAALGVGTMVLGGLGFFAARRAGGSRSDTVTWSLVSAGLGIVVILIKLVTSIRVKGCLEHRLRSSQVTGTDRLLEPTG
jgi:hypothetical protein